MWLKSGVAKRPYGSEKYADESVVAIIWLAQYGWLFDWCASQEEAHIDKKILGYGGKLNVMG